MADHLIPRRKLPRREILSTLFSAGALATIAPTPAAATPQSRIAAAMAEIEAALREKHPGKFVLVRSEFEQRQYDVETGEWSRTDDAYIIISAFDTDDEEVWK